MFCHFSSLFSGEASYSLKNPWKLTVEENSSSSSGYSHIQGLSWIKKVKYTWSSIILDPERCYGEGGGQRSSCLGTHVPLGIHVNVCKTPYNVCKNKNKVKIKEDKKE